MATPFPFVSGAVLTAAQLNDIQNLPINDVTANYVLVNNDRYKRVIMNNAGSTTITVNNSIFVAGDVIQISNKGAGSTVVTAGAGVTVNTAGSLTLAQYGGGYLLALSASTFTFFSGGGTGYGAATGGSSSSITVGGINYTLLTFTSTGTLTVTKAGFFDYLLVGGGGGALRVSGTYGAGGGGAGQLLCGSIYLSANQTITIGAGGAYFQLNDGSFTQGGNTSIGSSAPIAVAALGNLSSEVGSGSDWNGIYVGGGAGSITTPANVSESIYLGYQGGGSSGFGSGGGGGSSARGGNSSGTTGGTGGAGTDVSTFIGGSELRKAMGGGGGASGTGGTAATGGVAGTTTTTGNNGNANSGGGAGGGMGLITVGAGGSGIAYIRFK